MVILGRMLAWLGFTAAAAFVVMAGFRLYQSITGNYERAEALDDPLGSAIFYMMMASIPLGMLAGELVERNSV